MSDAALPVRLVLADRGGFHEVVVNLPAEVVSRHERLIDAIREDPEITRTIFIDSRRLAAAWVIDSESGDVDT